jgi:hypothetical protein
MEFSKIHFFQFCQQFLTVLSPSPRNSRWRWLPFCVPYVHGTISAWSIIWRLLIPLGGMKLP